MRIKFLIAGLLGVVSTTAFAQKGELNNAKESFDKYLELNKNQATYALADQSLLAAKTSIDKASTNAKTAQLPMTYAVKAAIYATLSIRDTTASKTAPLFATADEAYKKAKELDATGENKVIINEATTSLSQYNLNKGVNAFKAKNYDEAYKAFDYYRTLYPSDTTAVYYTGLAAVAGKNYPAALTAYSQLLPLTYSRKDAIYLDMSNIYLDQKDTVNALKMATEGVAKFPQNPDLRKREIEISLASGKAQELVGKIQAAIANDPKNKSLYYYAGLTYTSFGDGTSKDVTKLKNATSAADVAALAAARKKKDGYFAQAAEMYKKALEIDPDYFEANLNLGYALLAPAIDLYNFTNLLPASKQKEYDAGIKQANAEFEAAKPYIIKATELRPQSIDAFANLKTYYMGTRDMPNANATQKKIDELRAAQK